MKIGIISDIHANDEALSAVLEELKHVDRIFCLGDIVGYGPSPDACVEKIREIEAVTVLGNHDAALIGKMDMRGFGPIAYEALLMQMAMVSHATSGWLETCPVAIERYGLLLAHGAPPRSMTTYLQTVEEVRAAMARVDNPICMVGHTHVPGLYLQSHPDKKHKHPAWQIAPYEPDAVFHYDPHDRLLINPGSVGQPRDGNPLASFAVLDTTRRKLVFRRVAYNIRRIQRRIARLGLPHVLAERLDLGL